MLCPLRIAEDEGKSSAGGISRRMIASNGSVHRLPHAVSIIGPAFNSSVTGCYKVDNLVRIKDLADARASNWTLISSGSTHNGNETKVAFAVCARPLYGESLTIENLIEFVEVNRVFGAQLFFFYIEASVGEALRSCASRYQHIGLVESIPWNLPADVIDLIPEKG